MPRLYSLILLLFSGWLATGCGMVRHSARPAGPADSGPASVSQKPETAKAVTSVDEVQSNLMAAYEQWEGTPYRLGGSSQKGVDCSQLMNIIFDEYFDVDLPHNTRTQLNAGQSIRRKAIRAGDLIFFRTGPTTLHVGVAVNKGEFLHASTSSGVMISKLGNSYWRTRFLEARRVL